MQSQTLNRILLVMSPSAVLLVLAALGAMGNPVLDGLTRATVALVVLAYLLGVLATLWALQPFLRKAALGAELDTNPKR